MKTVMILVAVMALSACGRGPAGLNGTNGTNGQDGAVGGTGPQGDGCTVSAVVANIQAPNGGAMVICGSSSTLILNGSDGAAGAAATSPDILRPCPNLAGSYAEVLMRYGSVVVASFSSNMAGDNTRFTVLVPNTSYTTTDGRSCSFSINANGDLN